jgi:hypothetical protein
LKTKAYFPSHSKGFCKERLDDVAEDELCSECYLKSIQLDINQPIPDFENSPKDFNELKESCGVPTSSYPINPTTTGNPPPAM